MIGTMSGYRFKRQANGFGVFVGVIAEAVPTAGPPVAAEPAGDRVWLDASGVTDAFRGTPLALGPEQIGWLRAGLRQVAGDIAPAGHVTVVVRALEIVDVDYVDQGLAAAIAGWAAQEFGFPAPRAVITRDGRTGRYALDWA